MKILSNSKIKLASLLAPLPLLFLASNFSYAEVKNEEVNASYCIKADKVEVCTSEGSMTAHNRSSSTKVILITGENYQSGFKVKLKPNEKRFFKTQAVDYIDADIEFKVVDDFSKT